MQKQLEQLEKEYSIEWQEYKIGDLFDILTTKKKFNAADVSFGGKHRYIARGENNNGIRGYITEAEEYLNEANTISFGQDTATMFYQSEPYFTGDKIKVFYPKKHVKFNKKIAQAIIQAMKKAFSNFSWGSSSYNVSVLSSTKIQLPTVNNIIAFDYIEKFVSTLETERLATLELYMKTTGLSNCVIDLNEKNVLDRLEQVTWKEFIISDLFEKLNLKNNNKAFDKLLDTSTVRTHEFNLPLVNAKLGNNGIMFYGREQDFDSAEMTIDIVSNGAVATGTVYAQPYKVGVLWDAYLLKIKNQNMNKQKLLYLTVTLQKSIKTKFGWEDKAVWSKVQYEKISLPVKPDNTPDYEYMDLVISAMQKVVIKDVIGYLDQRIEKTKEIVGS
ncbi:restriction endonuclease subunit S [Acinetobacter johnsonii]|uniref:restriction endonuclease subunit S n=1 Tax=Acinetobacter johnsonii TaxID=40214 RepID=UPI000F67F0ED|nr:restriction endonuclease subunit S [Acinetobacter johnsonii]QYA54240.1 restriction endonuclease subunit S [Acinetobacter johnsonii]